MTAPKPVALRPETLWLLDCALVALDRCASGGGQQVIADCCYAIRKDLIDSGVDLAALWASGGKGSAIVPASDVPSPVSDETLRHLTECAHGWEPDACLLGTVTARQLQAFCAELAKLRADVPSAEERKVLEAMSKPTRRELKQGTFEFMSPWRELCEAELARRAAKEKANA